MSPVLEIGLGALLLTLIVVAVFVLVGGENIDPVPWPIDVQSTGSSR